MHDETLSWAEVGAVIGENGEMWYGCACGHLSPLSLEDGWILTAYGHYTYRGALIRWRPAS